MVKQMPPSPVSFTRSGAEVTGLIQPGSHAGTDDVIPARETSCMAGSKDHFGQGFLLFRDRGAGACSAHADGAAVAVDVDGVAGDGPACGDRAQMAGGGGKARLSPFGGVDAEEPDGLTADHQRVTVDDAGGAGEDVTDGGSGGCRGMDHEPEPEPEGQSENHPNGRAAAGGAAGTGGVECCLNVHDPMITGNRAPHNPRRGL